MNYTDEELYEAIAIVKNVVNSEEIKLEFGRQQREIIKRKLKNGEKVSGYRVEWLQDTVGDIAGCLAESADRFNTQNPHDKISLSDLVDALATAMHRFQK